MPARSLRAARAAALVAATLAVATVGCVRGRNDGGRDAAGLSSNGAGPAPQPGPLGGQNTDTTMAPAAVGTTPSASPVTPPAAASGGTATSAVPGATRQP